MLERDGQGPLRVRAVSPEATVELVRATTKLEDLDAKAIIAAARERLAPAAP